MRRVTTAFFGFGGKLVEPMLTLKEMWQDIARNAPLKGPEDLLSTTGDAAARTLEDYRSPHRHVRSLAKVQER